MIQRLVDALRLLAADAETQTAGPEPRQLAGEFADALLLLDSCQQLSAADSARSAMARIEVLLDAADGGFWSEAGVREDPRWRLVRREAAAALDALGQS